MNQFLLFLAQSTLILAAALVLARLPRMSAASGHLLLLLALLSLPVLALLPLLTPADAPLISLPVPQVNLQELFAVQAQSVSYTSSDAWTLPASSTILVAVYVVVGLLLACRHGLRLLLVANWLRRATPFVGRHSNHPVLKMPQTTASPFVWGFLRPRIVVPESALSWPDRRMRMVLAHEEAHIERLDVLTGLLSAIVCWCFWWHPLVWLSHRRAAALAELACDDAVLERGFGAPAYAQELINITRMTRPQVAPGMASTTHLAQRVQALLNERARRNSMSLSRFTAFTLIALLLLVPLSRISFAANPGPAPLDDALYNSLVRVQQLIDDEALDKAEAELLVLLEGDDVDDHGTAQVQNMLGYVAFLREDFSGAIDWYRGVVARADSIPSGLKQTTLYTLAQLFFVNGEYPAAIEHMHLWMAEADTPGPQPLVFIAQTYYQMDEYEEALDYLQQGLDVAAKREMQTSPTWLELLRYLQIQTGAIEDPNAESAAPTLGTYAGMADSDMLPIAKVAPVYPARAEADKVEGWVLVEFTVNELGGVSDPVVIESEPPEVFDAAALTAVRKFKYKPRVQDGAPVAVSGIRNRITFALSQDDAG